MAKAKSKTGKKAAKSPTAGWSALMWSDLEDWAGSRSVARGRSYQQGSRVSYLRTVGDEELLATVQGSEPYTVHVTCSGGDPSTSLESVCTCPVGFRCKHAVATIAEYLQAIGEGRKVAEADDDDPRWEDVDSIRDAFKDWDEDVSPVRASRRSRKSTRSRTKTVDWDDRIERDIRSKSQGELADLAWSLVRRFPEVYQEFRERLMLQEGDVSKIVAEARREIKKVTSESAWQNHWDSEGHIPDYSRVQHRLERLLELGHPDEVVSLGRDLIRDGMTQVREAHDEGETGRQLRRCLAIVFQAVARSSLSGPERILLAIDTLSEDDYDTIGEAVDPVLEASHSPEDWSKVADILLRRLKEGPDEGLRDDFTRKYNRDRLTDWIGEAMEHAGRESEVRALYEAEARITGSYDRLVSFLLAAGETKAAEGWIKEGIAATKERSPGIASSLAGKLLELARRRKQRDIVAAHAAHEFFDGYYPSAEGFSRLVEAARKAGVGEPVRVAALRYLETGVRPYRVVVPRPPAAPKVTGRRSSARTKPPAPAAPEPAAARVEIDREWPLPVLDYLAPHPSRLSHYRDDETPRPHRDVLLDMAIRAKDPDEVLRWYDAIRAEARAQGYSHRENIDADRVAAAISQTHPERAIAIYKDGMNQQLAHTGQSAYDSVVDYLKKLRPLYHALGRASEWTAMVASLRESYRNRRLFLERLDTLEGRTIVQEAKARR